MNKLNPGHWEILQRITIPPDKTANDFETGFTRWYQCIIDYAITLIHIWEESSNVKNNCKSGCSYCCNHLIEVYDFELLAILSYIRENGLESIFDKALSSSEYIEQKLKIPPIEYFQLDDSEIIKYKMNYRSLNLPCIFLKDNSCLIYPVRPTSCLNYNCYTSSSECSELYKTPAGCASFGEIEDWIISQVNSYLTINSDKVPHYLNPFDISILPVGIMNHILYNSDDMME